MKSVLRFVFVPTEVAVLMFVLLARDWFRGRWAAAVQSVFRLWEATSGLVLLSFVRQVVDERSMFLFRGGSCLQEMEKY